MIGQTEGNTELLQYQLLVIASGSPVSLCPQGRQHQVQAREDLSGGVRYRGSWSSKVRWEMRGRSYLDSSPGGAGGGREPELQIIPSCRSHRQWRTDADIYTDYGGSGSHKRATLAPRLVWHTAMINVNNTLCDVL